jgi:hypothetical protein
MRATWAKGKRSREPVAGVGNSAFSIKKGPDAITASGTQQPDLGIATEWGKPKTYSAIRGLLRVAHSLV